MNRAGGSRPGRADRRSGAGTTVPFGIKISGTGRNGGNQQFPATDLRSERAQLDLQAQPGRGRQQVTGPGPIPDQHHHGGQAGLAECGEGGARGRAGTEDSGAGGEVIRPRQGGHYAGDIGVVSVPFVALEDDRVGPADSAASGSVRSAAGAPPVSAASRKPGPPAIAGGGQARQSGLVAFDRGIGPGRARPRRLCEGPAGANARSVIRGPRRSGVAGCRARSALS